MYSSTSSDDEDEEQEDEDEPEVLVVEQYVQRVLVSPPIHSWDYGHYGRSSISENILSLDPLILKWARCKQGVVIF